VVEALRPKQKNDSSKKRFSRHFDLSGAKVMNALSQALLSSAGVLIKLNTLVAVSRVLTPINLDGLCDISSNAKWQKKVTQKVHCIY
jgi:hypothetical protein